MEPFHRSGMAIRGFQRPQIGPRRTQNVHFEAISEFGGSELVEQFGTRLEQVRADLGRAIGTLPLVRNDHYGHNRPSKWTKMAIFVPEAGLVTLNGSGSRLEQS